jgi:hypothetical protein
MGVSSQFDAPAALPRSNSTRYQLDRRLGEPQILSEHCEEKNLIPLPGIELQFLSHPAPVAIPTEIFRLSDLMRYSVALWSYCVTAKVQLNTAIVTLHYLSATGCV